MIRSDLRNVAIIAHVDHGKTTLVDALLKQSRVFARHEQVGELIMDSNDLEREKGITILAKNTSIRWGGTKLNIIDTPGHADFGGEVERVLSMADGCVILVDAAEGPMPQTRVVVRQALALKLPLIILINKVDRTNARPAEAIEATHELLVELSSDADQLDAPVLYAIAREGWVSTELPVTGGSVEPLLEAIRSHIPAPDVDVDGPFQMRVSALDHDAYRGRLAIGRISRGAIHPGDAVVLVGPDSVSQPKKIGQVLAVEALQRLPVEEAKAGEIVALVGIDAGIGDTVAVASAPDALPRVEVGEPTLRMQFSVNASPFAGREQTCSSTSRQLRKRLDDELRTNVALRVGDGPTAESFEVSGRGELHLAVLVETMRREGFEFEVSRPQVITRTVDGKRMEPVEECIVDAGADHVGAITEALGSRGAQLQSMRHDDDGGMVRLSYHAPTRALIGVRSQLLTLTRGTGVMSTQVIGWEPWRQLPGTTRNGALTSSQTGQAVAYGLLSLQERGQAYIGPGTPVYEGMIVGLNRRLDDLAVNVCKQKQKTNIRSSTSDFTVNLTPFRTLSLEESLDFLAEDELLEVTPSSLRLRKRVLNALERIKQRKRDGG